MVVAWLPHLRLAAVVAWGRLALRFLAVHTGLPAVVVAAVLLVLGYKLLRRTARFLLHVAIVSVILFTASELGWLRW